MATIIVGAHPGVPPFKRAETWVGPYVHMASFGNKIPGTQYFFSVILNELSDLKVTTRDEKCRTAALGGYQAGEAAGATYSIK